MGLRCQASTFDPCLLFVFPTAASAAGAFATHIDILGRGEPDGLAKMRSFPEQRFGELKSQEPSFVRVGMELAQGHVFSATLTQSDFTKTSQPIPTTPKPRATRQKLPFPEDVHLCRRKLGELRSLATVSRTDICARLASIAPRINPL